MLWTEYTQGKQTYKQLADKYHCSLKTIQRRLDKVSIEYQIKRPKRANIIMDTTYFGRGFGLMVFIILTFEYSKKTMGRKKFSCGNLSNTQACLAISLNCEFFSTNS